MVHIWNKYRSEEIHIDFSRITGQQILTEFSSSKNNIHVNLLQMNVYKSVRKSVQRCWKKSLSHGHVNTPLMHGKNQKTHQSWTNLAHFVVGKVPIQVDFPEGGLHKGGSPRVFPTDGEHMSMGISTNIKISSFSFLHSFLLVFFNFPDLSHQKIFSQEHGNVKI
jgi:hypothetical protein